ncbi:unnamed protein product [Bursaphelenchus xylophilus]|uniref:(pine wood nematode) hypothetical protein n=1 Tax=Bursaphelenchus xylophilus TaxID=6326 RepID=A0A1I7SAL1_BURXY|nr:unnamed protein product [Bursaphelenchus xylophilus]CAG9079242.1 unnamed protein product [Bursaphelenchus xylophilus]
MTRNINKIRKRLGASDFIRHLMSLPFPKPEDIEHYYESVFYKFRGLLGADATRLLIPLSSTWTTLGLELLDYCLVILENGHCLRKSFGIATTTP